MSHATGLVKFTDDTVLYFEYDGTSDVVCTALKRTSDELCRDWRSPANQAKCLCGNPEPVEMFADYGGGFSWDGAACRKCMAITEGLLPFDEDKPLTTRGVPEWATRIFSK